MPKIMTVKPQKNRTLNLSETLHEIEVECDTLKETLLAKNRDYGNSALEVPLLLPNSSVETAVKVRTSDKIKRLQRLLGGSEQQVKNESIDDTIGDLAGYCILWLIIRKHISVK